MPLCCGINNYRRVGTGPKCQQTWPIQASKEAALGFSEGLLGLLQSLCKKCIALFGPLNRGCYPYILILQIFAFLLCVSSRHHILTSFDTAPSQEVFRFSQQLSQFLSNIVSLVSLELLFLLQLPILILKFLRFLFHGVSVVPILQACSMVA